MTRVDGGRPVWLRNTAVEEPSAEVGPEVEHGLLEITGNVSMRASSVISASVMPSAKYSLSGSPFRFEKGNTASVGSANGRSRCTGAMKGVRTCAVAASPGAQSSRRRRRGDVLSLRHNVTRNVTRMIRTLECQQEKTRVNIGVSRVM